MWSIDSNQIKKLVSGDHGAFSEFYLATVDSFFRYLSVNTRIPNGDKEDILSEFFIKCWNSIPKYDGRVSFENFIWMLFKNVLFDWLRKRKLQAFSENEYKNEEGEVVSSFEDKLVSQDDVKKRFDTEYETAILNNALNNLDEDSREIIFMKYIEGFSYEHISVILGQQEANLRQRLFRALKKLKVLLEGLE